MSITTGVQAAFLAEATITAITPNVYCTSLPQVLDDDTKPSIVIVRTSSDPNNHLGGAGDMRDAYYDIECRGNEGTVATLVDAVEAAFEDFTGAMGTYTCKAAYLLSTDEDFEYIDDGTDEGQYLTTVQFQFQYS